MISSLILVLFAATEEVSGKNVKTTTPLMGWNSYNAYGCENPGPTEAIIKANAQGLVTLGFDKLGYTYVTPDCGWNSNFRDSSGRQVWNATRFPSGGKALADYIHGLRLKFGLYSGGGYYQCGSTDLPASLNHETTDAAAFASWGADSLKYDNCYSTSNTTMVDYTSEGTGSPTRFQTMASAIDAASRDIVFQVCQWGVGQNIGTWASKIADSWRISNDISNNWQSIWRITNEVVPYFKHTTVGAYPDMDMMIVGLKVLSEEEERFHFGMWAINKSPLIIGSPIDAGKTPATSLAIMSNKEVIAINQDSLGQQTQLIRRYTEEEWDIWAGNLSGSRMVVALANWKNSSSSVSVDLGSVLGIASAKARDVWAAKDVGAISGHYQKTLKGHELHILVLSDIVKTVAAPKSTGYHAATAATLSGTARKVSCSSTQCLPSHSKVGNIGQGSGAAAVTFNNVTAMTSGKKLLGVDFVNYDVALSSAWAGGTNTRNMTISINGGKAKRWAFPISGGDWYETGRLMVEVDGFKASETNSVAFRAFGDGTWAPDLVGFEVFE
ncbi:alpha-galactosidase [Coniochaeta sp. 2T2.1]|nr:alpha-galactosidase [Coniochaeta sp. 2T2.1]